MSQERHIRSIVDILARNIPAEFGLTSIVLYGGFARGEGRMVKDIPYGDYDLLVITERSLPEKLIQNLLNEKIYKEIMYGTSVDITNETVSTMKTINCDLSSYDLLKTGKTVWGEDLIASVRMDITDIPVVSFLRIINNRLNVILMEYGKIDSLKKSVVKLYLDIGGYLSFINRVYSPFFEERARNLKRIELDGFSSALVDRIELATKEKLKPGSIDTLADGLTCSLTDGIKVLERILGDVIGKDLSVLSVKDIAELIYRELPARYYRDFIACALRGKLYNVILNLSLPILGICANLYENIYFRKMAITRDKFSFRYEWRSPIIINMAVTFFLVWFLIEKKDIYLNCAGDYIKKILPEFNSYDFQNIKGVNTALWLGYTRRAKKRNIYKAIGDLIE